MLLWGPLIYAWGAYGAFAIQLSLLLISYILLLRYIGQQLPKWAVWMVICVLLGPVWFWFNEHPGIGWHPELTYFPLLLLFLLALLNERTDWFLITAILIVLVKEDGALLAGVVHVAYVCLQYLAVHRQQSVFGVLREKRFWLVGSVWAGLFLVGMLLLSYKNNVVEPEPRLQQALLVIKAGVYNPIFIQDNLILLGNTLLLLLPSIVLLVYVLYRFQFRQTGSVLLVYSIAQLILLLSNWVQGSTYYGTNFMFPLVSLTWAPRFVLMYAFSVCYVVAVWLLFGRDNRRTPAWQPVLLTLVLVLIQIPIVQATRSDFNFSTVLYDTLTNRFDPQKAHLLPASDVAVIERLAQTIPPRSNVFMFDYLIPFFHKHYNIWPTEKQWEKADLAIIPNDDFQKLGERLPRVMKQPLQSRRLTAYTIFFTPAYEPYVNASIK